MGNRNSGLATKELGKGIFAMTEEDRTDAARKSVEIRGYVPFVEMQVLEDRCILSEIQAVFVMSHNPDYRFGKGPNCKKLATWTNQHYHGGKLVRNAKSISNALYAYRS